MGKSGGRFQKLITKKSTSEMSIKLQLKTNYNMNVFSGNPFKIFDFCNIFRANKLKIKKMVSLVID